MKYFLTIVALLVGLQAHSQNWKDDIYESDSYAVSYRDKATGRRVVESREDIVLVNNDDTISIKIVKPEGGKLAFLGTIDGTDMCLPEKAPVFIDFGNNVAENFETLTKENCTGSMRFHLGGKWKRKKTMNLLRQNLVRKISIGGTEENHYYLLTAEEALDLRKTVNCVLYLQD